MPEDDDDREPLADAKAEVAAESAPPAASEADSADERAVPTLADQRVYPNGAADVLLRYIADEDDDHDEEPEEGEDGEDEEEPPAPVLIRVPRPQRWPDEAFECLRDRRSTKWAELVLSETSLRKWRAFSPDVVEVNDFLARWTDLTGQTAGKSRRHRRSLKAARAN